MNAYELREVLREEDARKIKERNESVAECFTAVYYALLVVGCFVIPWLCIPWLFIKLITGNDEPPEVKHNNAVAAVSTMVEQPKPTAPRKSSMGTDAYIDTEAHKKIMALRELHSPKGMAVDIPFSVD